MLIFNFENVSLNAKTSVIGKISIPRIPDFELEVLGNNLEEKLQKLSEGTKKVVKEIVLENGIRIRITIEVESPDLTKKTLKSIYSKMKTSLALSTSKPNNQTIFIPIPPEWVEITTPDVMMMGWEFS